MHIFLLGAMGTGKSTVGRLLATTLSLPFYDLDARIEAESGLSIAEIFKTKGELSFRDLETGALKALESKRDGVVATGGGVVLRAENRRFLHEHGRVIVLRAALGTLKERLASERGERPLLNAADWEARLDALLRERGPLYDEFPLQIWVDGKTPEDVVRDSLAIMKD